MQFINEENLGTEATESQARHLVQILKSRNINVEYGDSTNNKILTETEQTDFDAAFYFCLDLI